MIERRLHSRGPIMGLSGSAFAARGPLKYLIRGSDLLKRPTEALSVGYWPVPGLVDTRLS